MAVSIDFKTNTGAAQSQIRRLNSRIQQLGQTNTNVARSARNLNQVNTGRSRQNVRRLTDSVERLDNRSARLGRTMRWAFAAIGGAAVGNFAFRTAASFQTLELRLDTTLGSMEKAQSAMAGIRDLASSTPFAVQSLTDAFARLSATGSEFVETEKETLRLTQNISDAVAAVGGSGRSVREIGIAFSRMLGEGRVTAENLERFETAGIPVIKIAEEMGMSMGELREEMRGGEFDAIRFTEAFQRVAETGKEAGGFLGASERQNRSLRGSFSILTDEVSEFFDVLIRGSKSNLAIADFMLGFASSLDGVNNSLRSFFEGQRWSGFLDTLSKVGRAASLAFGSLGMGVSLVVSQVYNLGAGFQTAFRETQEFAQRVQGVFHHLGLSGVRTYFVNMFREMAATVDGALAPLRNTISGFVDWVISAFQRLYTVIVGNSIWPDMWSAIVRVTSKAIGPILSVVSGLFTAMTGIFGRFGTKFITVFAGLAAPVLAGSRDLDEFKNGLIELASVIALVGGLATRSFRLVAAGIFTIVRNFGALGSDSLFPKMLAQLVIWAGKISQVVKGFVEQVVGFFKYLYTTIVGNSIWPDMLNEMFDVAVRVLKIVVDTFRSFVDWVSEALKPLGERLKDFWQVFNQSAAMGAIASGLAWLVSRLKDFGESIGKVVSGPGEDFLTWIQNAWSGIKSLAESGLDFGGQLLASFSESLSGTLRSVGDFFNTQGANSLFAIGFTMAGLLATGFGRGLFKKSIPLMIVGQLAPLLANPAFAAFGTKLGVSFGSLLMQGFGQEFTPQRISDLVDGPLAEIRSKTEDLENPFTRTIGGIANIFKGAGVGLAAALATALFDVEDNRVMEMAENWGGGLGAAIAAGLTLALSGSLRGLVSAFLFTRFKPGDVKGKMPFMSILFGGFAGFQLGDWLAEQLDLEETQAMLVRWGGAAAGAMMARWVFVMRTTAPAAAAASTAAGAAASGGLFRGLMSGTRRWMVMLSGGAFMGYVGWELSDIVIDNLEAGLGAELPEAFRNAAQVAGAAAAAAFGTGGGFLRMFKFALGGAYVSLRQSDEVKRLGQALTDGLADQFGEDHFTVAIARFVQGIFGFTEDLARIATDMVREINPEWDFSHWEGGIAGAIELALLLGIFKGAKLATKRVPMFLGLGLAAGPVSLEISKWIGIPEDKIASKIVNSVASGLAVAGTLLLTGSGGVVAAAGGLVAALFAGLYYWITGSESETAQVIRDTISDALNGDFNFKESWTSFTEAFIKDFKSAVESAADSMLTNTWWLGLLVPGASIFGRGSLVQPNSPEDQQILDQLLDERLGRSGRVPSPAPYRSEQGGISPGQRSLQDYPGGYADGGHISGPGGPRSDSIPAMLSNGEYVVNAAAASRYRGLLEAINSGTVRGFADGGSVGLDLKPISGLQSDLAFGSWLLTSAGLNTDPRPIIDGALTQALNSGAAPSRLSNLMGGKADPKVYESLGNAATETLENAIISLGLNQIPGLGQVLSVFTMLTGVLTPIMQGSLKALLDFGVVDPKNDFLRDTLESFTRAPDLSYIKERLVSGPKMVLDYVQATMGSAFEPFANWLGSPPWTEARAQDRAALARPGPRLAAGGPVSGPGGPRSDSIPAMLSNGEYVINAEATRRNRALLEAINSGVVRGFADGGAVGPNVGLSGNTTPGAFTPAGANYGLGETLGNLVRSADQLAPSLNLASRAMDSYVRGQRRSTQEETNAEQTEESSTRATNQNTVATQRQSQAVREGTEELSRYEQGLRALEFPTSEDGIQERIQQDGLDGARAISGSIKNGLKALLKGESSPGEFFAGVLDTLTGNIIDTFVDSFTDGIFENLNAGEGLADLFSGISDWAGSLFEGIAGAIGGSAGGGGGFDILGATLSVFSGLEAADGGYISGPGTSRSDSIPARLSNGEYVVNAASTRKFRPMLEAINEGRSIAMSEGGLVDDSVTRGLRPEPSEGQGGNVVVQITGDVSRQTRKEVLRMGPELAAIVNNQNRQKG